MSDSLGERIADCARSYVGTPYYHCGRDRNGLDCAGLLVRVAHDLGLTDWDELDYSRQVDAEYLQRTLARFCDVVRRGPLAEASAIGDILLIGVWGRPQHLGVVTPGNRMVHAYDKLGRVVEHGLDETWKRCVVATYRWRIEG